MDVFYKMASIGIHITSTPFSREDARFVDIEETLLDAADAIAKGIDGRILSLILSWVQQHGEQVNSERLRKKMKSYKGNATWIGLFAFYGLSLGQSRWKLLAVKSEEIRTNGPRDMVAARARFKSEESWSRGTGFLIPRDSEPTNVKHVMTPYEISRLNHFYKNRLIYGASWRADLATAIDSGAKTPTEIAKWAGSSYEPAYRIFHDFKNAGLIV